jgi:hypothetical protein
MTLTYVLLEYGPFRSQFDGLPKDVQIAMSDEILKLKIDPFGPQCKRLEWDLEGIWRIHVGRINNILYCVAYLSCQDCKSRGYEAKFACLDCYKRYWYHIKLIACGRRDEFYIDLSKNWRTWMQTVEWKNLSAELE